MIAEGSPFSLCVSLSYNYVVQGLQPWGNICHDTSREASRKDQSLVCMQKSPNFFIVMNEFFSFKYNVSHIADLVSEYIGVG